MLQLHHSRPWYVHLTDLTEESQEDDAVGQESSGHGDKVGHAAKVPDGVVVLRYGRGGGVVVGGTGVHDGPSKGHIVRMHVEAAQLVQVFNGLCVVVL